MLSKFFLDRPVFAWVIAIVIMAPGVLGIYNLPISQYPPIAPPSIAITAFYPGASAETVENSVTQIIEQKMTGYDKLLYMSATSDSSGSSRLELTFAPGTDPDLAWAQVQNKLQLATASLPETVKSQGVQVSKSTRNYLMIISLISEDGSMDGDDLRDYAQSNLEKILARVPGVGEVQTFGSQYAMRIWLDPDRLTDYQLTVEEVIGALKTYNVEVSAGQFGGAPAVKGQRLNASIVVQNMLKTPEEFAAVPIRINPDGSTVRIRDIGRTELGTEAYDIQAFYNGKPAAGMAIRQAAGANALDTADAVKAKMVELSRFFPAGMKVVYPHDTTPFIRVAIDEVVKTLIEAILLVFLVMWLFLGTMRATLIPTIAVPVVILGTFAMLGFFGYSINMLTMFAMVLAIGLLVDDAIVVVENVERIMAEEGLPPREATAKSMEQITSALIGIGLVLSAVFGPMAFFPGSTGVIYRQFSVTIIVSMLLSVVVALILTPVLCASLLKPVPVGHEPADNAIRFLRPFFRWFDRAFFGLRDRYARLVGHSLSHKLRYLVIFVVIVAAMGILFLRMPTAYLPDEDQGMLLAQVIMPQGATLEQTGNVTEQIQRYFQEKEKETVESCLTIAGVGFSGRGQNTGMVFVKLKDWKFRDRADLKAKAIAGRAMGALSSIRTALVFTFPPPAVTELGNAKGFDFQLLDRGGLGREALVAAQGQLLGMAAKDPRLAAVRPNSMADVAEYRVDVDWDKAGALGVPLSSIHRTISAAFGSAYVNDFIQGGRVKRVYVQADAPYRMLPKDLGKLYVRNTAGKMVPLPSFATAPLEVRLTPAVALQRLPLPEHLGRAGAGEKLRRGHAGHGRDGDQAAHGDRLRLDGALLSGADVQLPGAPAVRLLDFRHLPVPGGPLRELADSHFDPPGPPPGGDRRCHRLEPAGDEQRRLFPDRPPDHPGADHQERHPDRPVRQGRDGAGSGTDGGHPGGGETAVSPDPDDLAGLRFRRLASGPDRRRGGGRPERHRHGRPGGDGDRHGPRGDLFASLLRADRTGLRQTQEG